MQESLEDKYEKWQCLIKKEWDEGIFKYIKVHFKSLGEINLAASNNIVVLVEQETRGEGLPKKLSLNIGGFVRTYIVPYKKGDDEGLRGMFQSLMLRKFKKSLAPNGGWQLVSTGPNKQRGEKYRKIEMLMWSRG